ncbi:hypothetical protein BKP35_04790 [Anaerobacillus arseniciselenatis]|uniref:Cytoplasmic protein n=1 Tax=Anaerobacillus arseniciselenatis TaxID=85682 RepID=A0A1S2LSH9_9BACI|nr:polymer-forming cytoskeletal protein [Anaerobacillus arseniciselenatis]OIJ15170.1 hypothetical protein BKP35_04790 [Anaerobacillus arseniciselenatis]
MAEETKKNLILSGNAEVSGGAFERVAINGNGTVNGNVNCIDLESNGSAKMNGDVSAKNVVIKGSTKIRGNVHAEEIEVQGNASIDGKLHFGTLQMSGNSSIKGELKGEVIELDGMVKIGGDCEVDTAKLNGAFTIDGLLNGDSVAINLHGKSSVKEIGGETITVKRDSAPILHLDKFIKILSKQLSTNIIEGDFIELEYTMAKVVRGNEIVIGPGCEIDLVEYSHDVHISEKACVKETKKI